MDYADDAQRTSNTLFTLWQKHRLKTAVDSSTDTSVKIDAPHYCECCGEEIPQARLLAVPTARYCCDCQKSLEKKSRNSSQFVAKYVYH